VTTVYLEDTVDVLGATLALVALVLHRVTGSALADALASLLIGVLLTYVAVRLASRNRAMLANASVPERVLGRISARLEREPEIAAVVRIEGVYLGPREALLAADVALADDVGAEAITGRLRAIRDQVRAEAPGVARLYLTPVAQLPAPAGAPADARESAGAG
jgi:divalent metal cation (Fe/Co/Zn/Cd) transporter